ncbi:MAG: HD domain-containing protein [Syntrophomonadaceae bacterium]|nr:HD domain-containing protein [Syntrophomonadaceae bacterium]
MRRIDKILKDPAYIDHVDHNAQATKDDPFCKHDLAHMVDVARIAYILVLERQDISYFIREARLRGREAAKEVIYAAGLLHDIGKWKEIESGVDHAAYGAHLAQEILERAGFDDNEIHVITHAIFEHRNISRDMSLLGERMHRADNLSRACVQCQAKCDCCKRSNKEVDIRLLY